MPLSRYILFSLHGHGINGYSFMRVQCDPDLPETTTVTRMATLIGPKPVTGAGFESRRLPKLRKLRGSRPRLARNDDSTRMGTRSSLKLVTVAAVYFQDARNTMVRAGPKGIMH